MSYSVGAMGGAGTPSFAAMDSLRSAQTSFGAVKKKPSVDETAQDFEAMFVSQMMKPMFDSVEVDAMFGGGHGEEMMRGFLVQEYGKLAAARGDWGLTDSVKQAILQAQGNG